MEFQIINEVVLGIVTVYVLSALWGTPHTTGCVSSATKGGHIPQTQLSSPASGVCELVQCREEEKGKEREREKSLPSSFPQLVSPTVSLFSVTQPSWKSRPDNQISVCPMWEPQPRCVWGFSGVCGAVCVGEVQDNLLTIYVRSPG